MKEFHLVLNSNKWFSAVSDYSMQLTRFLAMRSHGRVLYLTHPGSPMRAKLEAHGVACRTLPLLPRTPFDFLRSWRAITRLLKETRADARVVWTFEGREHTLCALHRLVCRGAWKGTRLVRVRGQAAPVKGRAFNRWAYLKGVDKVVFAARVVAARTPISFRPDHACVFPYCCDAEADKAADADSDIMRADTLALLPKETGAPPLDFSQPVFMILGRFDPVKGHAWIIDAFADAALPPPPSGGAPQSVQFVFVGLSENVKSEDLHAQARARLGTGVASGKRSYAGTPGGLKRVYILDERCAEAGALMRRAHFGVVPSFDSEVICRVAVEFMQLGTPVLVSDAGALPEIVKKVIHIENGVIHRESEVIHRNPGLIFASGESESWNRVFEEALSVLRHVNLKEHTEWRKTARAHAKESFSLSNFDHLVHWVLS